eukprot:408013_1
MSRKQTDCASTNHNNKTTKSNSKLNQKQKRKKIENGEWFYDENDTLKAKGVWNIFNKLYENDNSFQDTLGAIIVISYAPLLVISYAPLLVISYAPL